jgi:tricarballylate dehydrogenase
MPGDRPHLIVVGHGAAGLAAALAAAEAGPALQVTVLERAAMHAAGGGTRWSPCNLRMQSMDALAPGFEADMTRACGPATDRAYFARLAAEAPDTIGWVARHGVAFHAPGYYLSAGPPRIQPVGGGAALVDALAAAARRARVAFHYGCTVESLVRRNDGHVDGVAMTRDGVARSLAADAVVLASGGFQGNPAMLRQHFGPGGESLRPISPGSSGNGGAGIRMALAAGARPAGDWNGMHAEPVDARSTASAPVVLVYPYGIVVDREGRRFFDEGAGLVHETWERFARAIHFETPGRRAWAILDSRYCDIPGFERAIRSDVPPLRADSIDALAALAGVSPEGLAITVARYNAACTGAASRFDATRTDGLAAATGLVPPKSNWARALDRPPYFAFPLAGAIAYTFGGIATNPEAEVLGAQRIIPGLYAAGEITGHFHGTAPNAVAVLRALVFGRIAGRNAAVFALRA